MSLKGAGYIVGAYEHPTRKATDKSVTLLHAECAKGALEDAGLKKDDIDGYFCAGDAPGLGPLSMVDYMNLKCRHVDSTDVGGSSYQVAVGHALDQLGAAIGRSVVDHDHLEPLGRIVLVQSALQRLLDEAFVVVGGNEHADLRQVR